MCDALSTIWGEGLALRSLLVVLVQGCHASPVLAYRMEPQFAESCVPSWKEEEADGKGSPLPPSAPATCDKSQFRDVDAATLTGNGRKGEQKKP